MDLFECPDCRRMHDEPAEPMLGLHIRCLDCELELRYREASIRTVVIKRAA